MKPPDVTPPPGIPIASLEEIEALDRDEKIEGYLDGRAGEPCPGENRSLAYRHGWWIGMADAGRRQLCATDRQVAHEHQQRELERAGAR